MALTQRIIIKDREVEKIEERLLLSEQMNNGGWWQDTTYELGRIIGVLGLSNDRLVLNTPGTKSRLLEVSEVQSLDKEVQNPHGLFDIEGFAKLHEIMVNPVGLLKPHTDLPLTNEYVKLGEHAYAYKIIVGGPAFVIGAIGLAHALQEGGSLSIEKKTLTDQMENNLASQVIRPIR